MWLTRPRTVREYRDWNGTWQDCGPFPMALVAAVDRVHTNATLRGWWRYGELVPNRARPHPYQQAIPEEYQGTDRWFLLETDANNPEGLSGFVDSPDTQKEIRVFPLALTRGRAPERQWLVYAHSPLAERDGVQITVPEYGDITVHASVAGSFCLIDERAGSTTPVSSLPATSRDIANGSPRGTHPARARMWQAGREIRGSREEDSVLPCRLCHFAGNRSVSRLLVALSASVSPISASPGRVFEAAFANREASKALPGMTTEAATLPDRGNMPARARAPRGGLELRQKPGVRLGGGSHLASAHIASDWTPNRADLKLPRPLWNKY